MLEILKIIMGKQQDLRLGGHVVVKCGILAFLHFLIIWKKVTFFQENFTKIPTYVASLSLKPGLMFC